MSLRFPSSSRRGIFSRVRTVLSTFFDTTESPRHLQECSDLYQTLLLGNYRNLRIQHDLASHPLSMSTKSRSELEQLYDKASDSLEHDIHTYTNRGLRKEVQHLIHPQIISLLKAFQEVDSQINTSLKDGTEPIISDKTNQEEVVQFCKSILLDEWQQMMARYTEKGHPSNTSNSNNVSDGHLKFLKRKSGALKILASHYGYETELTSNERQQSISNNISYDTSDKFGYFPSTNDEINDAIRYHQMLNMTKSILLRQIIGYSVTTLKSSISHSEAGRGVYIDGFAPAGSIVAFFPGQVWPKEHLLKGLEFAKVFDRNPNYHLSVRYDDIIIDSRNSPYTVLNGERSNPFAVGHIVNHPPKPITTEFSNSTNSNLSMQNCSTVMVDFTESMFLTSQQLSNYIPNIYARPPMILGPKAFDDPKHPVLMHGYGLLTSRDVCNEELFYDYRLSPSEEDSTSCPDWYHVCNEEESEQRWFQK